MLGMRMLKLQKIWLKRLPMYGKATNDMVLPENTLMAVNMEYVEATHGVKADDEVAFFPPVTGG